MAVRGRPETLRRPVTNVEASARAGALKSLPISVLPSAHAQIRSKKTSACANALPATASRHAP